MLRRRIARILRPSESGRSLNLRSIFTRIDYWRTGSKFESTLLHYALARRYFPDTYLKLTRLRMPAYLRLILSNEFPRTQVTTHLTGGASIYYGPFRTRAAAELFETQLLDLFQIRRCDVNLEPSPDHPGCIYGEMNMCLRPCQQVVGVDEYRSEVNRVANFLETNGAAQLSSAEAARDKLSEEMNFEEAARQHKRIEGIESVLSLRDDLVRDIRHLYVIVVTKSLASETVTLWFSCQGSWQPPIEFPLTSDVSLDRRLRDLIANLKPEHVRLADRQEHLALLARWAYSSWRDGELLIFDTFDKAPYRKLVRAVSRVHQA